MAEVTITMEDPELAEAARFVMEGRAAEGQGDFSTEGTESAEKNQVEGECATATATRDGAQLGPDAASADAAAESTEESVGRFKKLFKRKKRAEDKPVVATKPGEIMVSR